MFFPPYAKELNDYRQALVKGFIDNYKNVKRNEKYLKFRELNEKDYEIIGKKFSEIAKNHNMTVQTCFEDRNLGEYGFKIGECISHQLAFKLTGKTYKNWTARKERKCNCVQMVDIGYYNSCKHFCKYCYANYDEKIVNKNCKKHNPKSSLLIGEIESDNIIKERIK